MASSNERAREVYRAGLEQVKDAVKRAGAVPAATPVRPMPGDREVKATDERLELLRRQAREIMEAKS